MTRKRIHNKILANHKIVTKLLKENNDLKYQALLKSDRKQQYTETEEDIIISRRPKKIERCTIGRIHWKETFIDEGTGKGIVINRVQNVKVNGKWVV